MFFNKAKEDFDNLELCFWLYFVFFRHLILYSLLCKYILLNYLNFGDGDLLYSRYQQIDLQNIENGYIQYSSDKIMSN